MKRFSRTLTLVLCLAMALSLLGSTPALAEGLAFLTEDLFPTLENPNITIVYNVTHEQYDKRLAENPNALDNIYETKALFEAKYGGTVNIVGVPWEQMGAKTVAMQAADDAPDLYLLSDQSFPLLAVKNILQPIDEVWDASWVDPVYMGMYEWKGQHYGVGLGAFDVPYIMFNKTMFELEGIKDPYQRWLDGEWNFDALYECGTAMTRDTDGDGAVDQWGFSTWGSYVSQLIIANGGRMVTFDEEGYHSGLKDPKTIEALTFIQKMITLPGGFLNVENYATFQQDFVAGKLAMTHGVYMPKPSQMRDEVGIVPFPYGPSTDKDTVMIATYGWGLVNGAKNPQGAEAFLYLNDQMQRNDQRFDDANRELYGEYYDVLYNTPNRTYEYSNDRNINDVWGLFWALADDLRNGVPPATVAETFDPLVYAACEKSYGRQ